MGKALEFNNIRKNFPGFSLEIDSLELPRGSIMGLVGANGAGKSTFIKLIMNLMHPDNGSITVLDRDINKQELEIKNRVGYVPEENHIYEEVTPEWVGRFVSNYYTTWDHTYYRKLLQKLLLPGNKKVKDLSKGNKMKLSLALALAHKPELLLLDEPTSGLDPVVRNDILQELLEIIQDEARSVLFSSHIVGDIEKIADYVALLREGKLVLFNDKEEILEKWKKLQFRLPGYESRSNLPTEFSEYIVQCKNEGCNFQVITGNYPENFFENIKTLGAENIQITPLSLEEVMIVISREVK